MSLGPRNVLAIAAMAGLAASGMQGAARVIERPPRDDPPPPTWPRIKPRKANGPRSNEQHTPRAKRTKAKLKAKRASRRYNLRRS